MKSAMVAAVLIALWYAGTGETATPPGPTQNAARNSVKIRRAGASSVEIEVASERPFPVTNALAVLHVGKQEATLSRYPADGDLHTLIFTMDARDFARTKDGDAIRVEYSPDSQEPWDFGPLKKDRIDR